MEKILISKFKFKGDDFILYKHKNNNNSDY